MRPCFFESEKRPHVKEVNAGSGWPIMRSLPQAAGAARNLPFRPAGDRQRGAGSRYPDPRCQKSSPEHFSGQLLSIGTHREHVKRILDFGARVGRHVCGRRDRFRRALRSELAGRRPFPGRPRQVPTGLEAQDGVLSRHKPGFESPWGRQLSGSAVNPSISSSCGGVFPDLPPTSPTHALKQVDQE